MKSAGAGLVLFVFASAALQAQQKSADRQALLRSAMADERAGDAPAAVRKLEQIVSGPGPVELLGQSRLELLRIFEKSGEWWKALDQLEALRKLNPSDPEYAYRSGVIYRNLSQWAFERMKTLAPKSARFQQALGEQYSVTGDWAEATRAFRQALESEPRSAGSHLALAVICLRTGKPLDALAELREELAIAPESSVAKQLKQSIEKGVAR